MSDPVITSPPAMPSHIAGDLRTAPPRRPGDDLRGSVRVFVAGLNT